MRQGLTLQSPAKINLFLEVLGRRADGYHTLTTLFQEISLADTLRARVRLGEKPSLSTNNRSLPTDDSNLVLRAARAFGEKFPKAPPLHFSLLKRIPMGAGLGGGSGNAAAALKACWALATGRAPEEAPWDALWPLARRLGADVPFFLKGGLAAAGGVGDRLTFYPKPPGPRPYFVLVDPGVFSSTPEAYRRLRFPLTKRHSGLRLVRALRDGAPAGLWAPWLFNRLEEVVLPRLAPVARAKRALLRAGCLNALMSGSGSCVFGVVENATQGRRVIGILSKGIGKIRLVSAVHPRTPEPLTIDEVGLHGNHRDSRFAPQRGQAEGFRHRHL